MRSFLVTLIPFLVLVLSACQSNFTGFLEQSRSQGTTDNSTQPPSPENPELPAPPPPPEIQTPNLENADELKVCYPGAHNQFDSCFATISKSDLDLPEDEYLDPFNQDSFPTHFDPFQYLQPTHVLILENVPEDTQLSPHFRAGRLMSLQKGSIGIFSVEALVKIQELRDSLNAPVVVHSAYRSPNYNRLINGALWSRHMYGDAIDFHVSGVDFSELSRSCFDHGAGFALIYETHIHCDWRSTPLDPSFFPIPETRPLSNLKSQMEKAISIESRWLGDHYLLQVKHPPFDDEGDPIYQWTLQDPQGITLNESGSTVKLIPTEKGDYHIRVTVGGTLTQSVVLSHQL